MAKKENKEIYYHNQNILNSILELGGQVGKGEVLFGTVGANLYDLKGIAIRMIISCVLCTLISGVTLIFVEKNWLENIIVVFLYIFFVTLFVELSRFVCCRIYARRAKKELSGIAIVFLTGLLSAVFAAALVFFINQFKIHNLFMHKPWPVLSMAGFIIGVVIMGTMVLYRRMFGNLTDTFSQIEELYISVLHVLSAALEIKDTYTRGHSERVSLFATALAREWGFSDKDVEIIKEVAVFHDIGKIGIPENILRKDGPLTDEEWGLIKNHPVMSAKILEPLKYLKEAIPMVEYHHERYDGKGYPLGLSGEQIPVGAQIIALADVLDAMSSTRSYRKAMALKEVRQQIAESSGAQFSPPVVEVFLRLWDKDVFLNNMEKA